MVFATPDCNPGGADATYDNSPIGVWHDKQPRPREWWVITQTTRASMPIYAAFNLLIYRTR